VVLVVGCVDENDCGGGGCLELSKCECENVSECLDGRRTDRGGNCNPIKRSLSLILISYS
jgi:hypothetical protein